MILYGAGSFLLKAYEAACAAACPPIAYFSEPLETSPLLPIPHLGSYNPTYKIDAPIFLAFGDNTIRRNLYRRLRHPLAKALIHPSAQVASSARIGEGAFVAATAQVEEDAFIGALAIVEEGAVIARGASVGEGAFIGPFSHIGMGTVVEAYAYIGARAIVQSPLPEVPLLVGEGSIIGTRARLHTSCPPFSCILSEKP